MGQEWQTANTFVRGGCEENPVADPDAVDEAFSEETFGPSIRPLPTPVRRRLFQRQPAPSDNPEARAFAVSGPPCPQFSSPKSSIGGSPLKRDKMEHAEEEPRVVCRRLDNLDFQQLHDDPQDW